MTKTLWLILGLVLLIGGIWLVSNDGTENSPRSPSPSATIPRFKPTNPSNTPATTGSSVIISNIPFTPQAPFGNWADQRQEDGCEEASALMAVYWIRGKTLNPLIAEKEILAISDYEQKTYGSYHDTSADDTNTRIIKGYFGYLNAEVKHNVDLEDIKSELRKGNALIAPMNGQKLANPHYKAPGPLRHMLVVKGYDPVKKEIITNDPGTRFGESYRYREDLFMSAMQDYASGYHEPITTIRRSMIVISKP